MASTLDPGSTPSIASQTPVGALLRVLSEERSDVGLVYLYAILTGLLGLSVPLGVQVIFGLVSGGLLLQPVVILIGVVVVATFGAGWLQVLQLGVVERIQQRLFARESLGLAHRIARVDLERVGGVDLPEQTNRFFEVVTLQSSVAKLLTEAVPSLLTIAFGLILLTLYHPFFAAVGGMLFALLGVVLWITGQRGIATSLAESSAKYRVAHWLQELARHAPVFALARSSSLPVDRLDRTLDDYLEQRQAHFQVLARQSMLVIVIKTLITGGLLIIGTLLVVRREIGLGQFVASELVIVTILAGVEKLIWSLSTVYDALTAADKLEHLRQLPVLVTPVGVDGEEPAPYAIGESTATRTMHLGEHSPARLMLRGVGYQYEGSASRALHDITFHVSPGGCVALAGSEGAGTSTLLRLIAGSLRSFEGAVTVDDRSIRDLPAAELQAMIALVAPQPELVDGTVYENITLGRPRVSAAEVAEAIQLTALGDVLASLPDGLRTAASTLPTHVTRKVVLARALAGRPRVLLFDYYFHHLDPEYKCGLLHRLRNAPHPCTILAASHDPAFLVTCDQVLVVSEGRIVRAGTYAALAEELRQRNLIRMEVDVRFSDAAAMPSGVYELPAEASASSVAQAAQAVAPRVGEQ